MGSYAVIDVASTIVINMVVWDGIEPWYPPEGCIAVETYDAAIGWTYVNGVFHAPPEPEPTPQEIMASQSAKLQGLTQLAQSQKTALTNRIATLNDAIELEMAAPEEVAELPVRKAQLIEWKRYAVLLGRVTSQEGWPPEVDWPVQPEEGMDLSVSSRSNDDLT